MRQRIVFLHTSPPAIAPLIQHYGKEAPEFEIVNLLDDGVLDYFRRSDLAAAQAAIEELLRRGVEKYQAQAALLTCSSVSGEMLRALQAVSPVPLLKVDVPMAEAAMRRGGRIGIAYTFAPTLGPTTSLFGSGVELLPYWIAGAYDALLAGQADEHDRLLLAGLEVLREQGAEVIVLAQVSMARVLPRLRKDFGVPVWSSLETSLAAMKAAMEEVR